MKHLNLFIAFFMFAATLFLVGCSDDDEKAKPIVVENETSLTQDVYADKTEGNSVNFATTGAWTSSIKAKTPTRDASQATDWVSLNPSSGSKAGNYTVSIMLEPNNTGEDRSATISILCEGSEITINITQKATKEDGKVLGKTIAFKVYSCNDQWTPENNVPYFLAKDAEVKVYSGTTLVGTYTTDENGIAEAELEDGEYSYRVTRGKETNINSVGLLLAGIYTTQEEIEAIQGAMLGYPKIVDVNADGIINDQDKVENATITVSKDEVFEVYIASEDFTPTYEPFELGKVMNRLQSRSFPNMLKESYLIDASITREATLSAPYDTFMNFSFNMTSEPVSSLWDKAYAIIKDVNWVYENIDNLPNVTEEDKRRAKAEASFYRIYAYSTLLNYFGGVPIYTTSSFENMPRSTVQEVVNYIFDQGDFIADNASDPQLGHAAFQVMARTAINKHDFQDVYSLTQKIIDSSVDYKLHPDGSCDYIWRFVSTYLPTAMRKYNSASLPTTYFETLFLHAEAALGLGRNMEAIQIVNQIALAEGKVPVFPNGGATSDEIQNAIASIWKEKLDREGHAFARLKRTDTFLSVLGSFGAKERHLLFPIPATAVNHKITQNPGW